MYNTAKHKMHFREFPRIASPKQYNSDSNDNNNNINNNNHCPQCARHA